MRRRDGTPYAADCRRAIQANLRFNALQGNRTQASQGNLPLFRVRSEWFLADLFLVDDSQKAPNNPKAWCLVHSMEDASSVAEDAPEEEKKRKPSPAPKSSQNAPEENAAPTEIVPAGKGHRAPRTRSRVRTRPLMFLH